MTETDAPADLSALTPEDGWDDLNGCGMCPICERVYSGNGGYIDGVYATDGTYYAKYYDSPGGEGPYVCEPCWTDHETAYRQQVNRQLTDFEQTDSP